MTRRSTRPATPPGLIALRTPGSTTEQIAALKQLKNDLIGHEQRKHLLILRGIVEPLSRLLATTSAPSKASGKRRSGEVNGTGASAAVNGSGVGTGGTYHGWTEEDELRAQAIHIVGSLAHG